MMQRTSPKMKIRTENSNIIVPPSILTNSFYRGMIEKFVADSLCGCLSRSPASALQNSQFLLQYKTDGWNMPE